MGGYQVGKKRGESGGGKGEKDFQLKNSFPLKFQRFLGGEKGKGGKNLERTWRRGGGEKKRGVGDQKEGVIIGKKRGRLGKNIKNVAF